MGFLDNVNPVKAVKDGWNAVTETAGKATDLVTETLSKPVEATKSLFNSAVETTKSVVSSVTNIDLKSLSSKLTGLGTILTNPVGTVVNGVSSTLLSSDAQAVVKNISALALATNPMALAASLTIAQVSPNKWMSADKTIQIEKVDSLAGNKDVIDFNDFWKMYDEQNKSESTETAKTNKPQTTGEVVDFGAAGDIYRSDRAQQTKDAKEFTNAAGEQVTVTAREGEIAYTATKDGKVVTRASQTAEQSTITHKGETATLDRQTGVLNFTSEQVKILQTAERAEVNIEGGRRAVRENGEIKIYDSKGNCLQTLKPNEIKIGTGDIQVFTNGTDLNAKADQQQASQAQEIDPEIKLLLTPDGDALATLKDGSRIHIRKQGDALILLQNGGKLIVEASGRVLKATDKGFVPVSTEDGAEGPNAVNTGGVQVKDGQIQFEGGSIRLDQDIMIQFRNKFQQLRQVNLGRKAGQQPQAEQAVRVETPEQTVVAQENKMTTSDAEGNTFTTDIAKGSVDMPEVSVAQDEIRVKHEDREDTIIKSNNQVSFEGGKGPELREDGSMKLDEQTETDAEGNVRSGGWQASSYSGSAASLEAGKLDARAMNAAMSAKDSAQSVYAKALSGRVTMSDIGELNGSLGSVTAMINMLAAAGRTDLIPQLQNSCSAIIEAINFATPRVAQNEQSQMKRAA